MVDRFYRWLEFQSTIDKIFQPLIEIYQLLIFFINGILFDNFLLTVIRFHIYRKYIPNGKME